MESQNGDHPPSMTKLITSSHKRRARIMPMISIEELNKISLSMINYFNDISLINLFD
jgi:hypothetical protein